MSRRPRLATRDDGFCFLVTLGVAAWIREGPVGPILGWDPGRRFPASVDPLADVRRRAGGPATSGWPLTLTSAVRGLSAKMAGMQAVPHEGTWPSGVCRWGPGSVDAWRASGLPHVGTWFF